MTWTLNLTGHVPDEKTESEVLRRVANFTERIARDYGVASAVFQGQYTGSTDVNAEAAARRSHPAGQRREREEGS